MRSKSTNGWAEHQKLVLAELRRLSEGSEALARDLQVLRVEVARLQVKAGAWGAAAGVLAVLAALLLKGLGQ